MIKNKKVLAVIPARYNSTRFPGKPLALLNGKAMIIRTIEQVKKCKLISDIVVATDNKKIATIVEKAGYKYVITSKTHKTGTDRVYEAAKKLKATYILNVQGDEPFISVAVLNKVIKKGLTLAKKDLFVTCASPFDSTIDINDINKVKVVVSKSLRALYFSRSAIPNINRSTEKNPQLLLHAGIYFYSNTILEKFVKLPQSFLEKVEQLEQLRAIENDINIYIVKDKRSLSYGIDTPKDLKYAEKHFKE